MYLKGLSTIERFDVFSTNFVPFLPAALAGRQGYNKRIKFVRKPTRQLIADSL